VEDTRGRTIRGRMSQPAPPKRRKFPNESTVCKAKALLYYVVITTLLCPEDRHLRTALGTVTTATPACADDSQTVCPQLKILSSFPRCTSESSVVNGLALVFPRFFPHMLCQQPLHVFLRSSFPRCTSESSVVNGLALVFPRYFPHMLCQQPLRVFLRSSFPRCTSGSSAVNGRP
jgi:hypothetical protein